MSLPVMLRRLAFGLLLLLPLAAVAEQLTLKDGDTTLTAELKLADGKSLEDGVIVMLHGTLAHSRMEIMQAMQNVMAARGYSSLAVNLGYGISNREGMMDCAATHTHRHEDAVREVGLWVDWLKGQGAGQLALLGHSRGGNQIAMYAKAHPEMNDVPMILIAPATHDADQEAKAYKERYGKPLDSVVKRAEGMVKAGKGDELLKGIGFVYCEDATATARSVVSYYDATDRDTPALLAGMKRPALVFAGSEDTTVADLPEKMAPIADGETIRFEVIDGADHFFRDLYAEDVADIIEGYLGW
ncbi:MAG: alpha/beta hydrolase [Gammaproteobacteria bacterium]|nr:alpha/beta hydrolase [Gammaproteobacteria bacterium]